jgi:hypothetical protein
VTAQEPIASSRDATAPTYPAPKIAQVGVTDNEDIDIAVGSHFSPGRRAKQDDAQGMNRPNDTPDQLIEEGLVRVHSSFPLPSIFR